MYRTQIILLLAFALGTFTYGCDGDDDSSDNTREPGASALVGVWEYDDAEFDEHNVVTFNANGYVTSKWTSEYADYGPDNGTYAVNGHNLTMTLEESEAEGSDTYTCSEETTGNFHIDGNQLCMGECYPFVRQGDTFTAYYRYEAAASETEGGETYSGSGWEEETETLRLLSDGQCEVAEEWSYQYEEIEPGEAPYTEQDSGGETSVTCTYTQSGNTYTFTGEYPPDEDEDTSFEFTIIKFGSAWITEGSLDLVHTRSE